MAVFLEIKGYRTLKKVSFFKYLWISVFESCIMYKLFLRKSYFYYYPHMITYFPDRLINLLNF